jgi:hypothetical protein
MVMFEWFTIPTIAYLSIILINSLPMAMDVIIYILAVILIGFRFFAAADLLKYAGNHDLVQNSAANDFIGEVFVAWPLLSSLSAYRQYDGNYFYPFKSHKDGNYPQTKNEFFVSFFMHLFGLKAFHHIKKCLETSNTPLHIHILKLCIYAGVACLAVIFGFWKALILYWLVPYFTVFSAIMYVIGVLKHYGTDYEHELIY